jgi:hypothetical protein
MNPLIDKCEINRLYMQTPFDQEPFVLKISTHKSEHLRVEECLWLYNPKKECCEIGNATHLFAAYIGTTKTAANTDPTRDEPTER